LCGALLPRPLRLLAIPLVIPYLRVLRARAILTDGGLRMVPYFALHDAIEVVATARGGLRGRRLMI
jgi:hypothetical protein